MLRNRLLAAIILGIAAYWTIGYLIPGLWLSSTFGGALLVFGVFAFIRYGRGAYDVVVHGYRSENRDGSHLAVLGMAFIAFGSVYVGGFSLIWNIAGQPEAWLGSIYSTFGRAVMTVGFALMYFSPDVGRPDPRTPPYIWFAIMMAVVALFAYFLGTQFAATDTPTSFRYADRPVCPQNRPVWGNDPRKIYHVPSSPWRGLTYPNKCFKDEKEAISKGYREPK